MTLSGEILKSALWKILVLGFGVWIFQESIGSDLVVKKHGDLRNASPPAESQDHELLPIELQGHDQYIR